MDDRDALVKNVVEQLRRRFQHYLDKTVIYPQYRWLAFVGLLIVYALRVWSLSGWYIVTYGLAIYLLNLFIGFISPQFDPESREGALPSSNSSSNEEFRPFERKVGEFPCWFQAVRAIIIAFCMTFFSLFDVPVFWPILLVYFAALFGLTMRNQISHMFKHRYVPLSWGKATYGGKDKKKGALGAKGGDGGSSNSNGGGISSAAEAMFKGSSGAALR